MYLNKKDIIWSKTLSFTKDNQIKNHTDELYEKIKQNQLKLLQDTVNFENELTDRLAQLNIKHKEIETKIIKYDNIFNNVPLDANRMNY